MDLVKAGCYGFIVRYQDEIAIVITPAGNMGFPKGKKHKGEGEMQCALRELYEETGLTFDDIIIEGPVKVEYREGAKFPSTVYFTATAKSRKPLVCADPKELSKVDWYPISALLDEPKLDIRRRKLIN
jgi:8-oxo-dGTP pyrophosphatase MutT (NUDIX family)